MNPFLQNFFAYSQQNPWMQQGMQQPNPQMMLGSQMPMYQQPMMGGLLGKGTYTGAGKIPPVSGRPVQGTNPQAKFPTMRTLAVRG